MSRKQQNLIPQENSVTAIVVAPDGAEHDSDQGALISLVLDGLDSGHTRTAYERALRDFFEWVAGQPVHLRQLNRLTVNKYRAYLRDTCGLSASSINQRLSAIRKLAKEAAENEFIPRAQAAGIADIAGVRQEGRRKGNWLSKEDAQRLLDAPDCDTLKGLRDRAIIAVLLGCALRRQEAASLLWSHIQMREGRPIIVDLVGKRNKMRSVPMPIWCKAALDNWRAGAGLPADGYVWRAVNKHGQVVPDGHVTDQTIRNVVKAYSSVLGLPELAPHDLRRTFAKLSLKGGAELTQIQQSLGHASLTTTQMYLGLEQDLENAPADLLGLY